MFSQEVQVTNQVGLYARPATFFIQCANGFKSTILVERKSAELMQSLCWAFCLWASPRARQSR